MRTDKAQSRWITFAILCVALAIGLHSYLTSQYYDLKVGLTASESICNVNDTFNCDAVSASSYSSLLGIPMALWGAVTNGILLILLILLRLQMADDLVRLGRYNLWIASFVALVSVVMAVISFTLVSSYCLFCIAAYILSFATFFALLQAMGPGSFNHLMDDIKDLFQTSRWVLWFLVAIPAVAFIAHKGIKEEKGVERVQAVVQDSLVIFRQGTSHTFTQTGGFVLGNPNAPIRLVEFADFLCVYCKEAAPTLKAFVSAHPDVQLLFKPFPLDGTCNAALSQSGNGVSCRLSEAVYCGESVANKGAPIHDWIFERQNQWRSSVTLEQDIEKMAKALEIPWPELKACMDAPETRQAIKDSAKEGQEAKVQGTPAVYMNGRRLPNGQILPVLREAYQQVKQEQ